MQRDKTENTTAFFPRKSRVTGVTLAMLSLLFLPHW